MCEESEVQGNNKTAIVRPSAREETVNLDAIAFYTYFLLIFNYKKPDLVKKNAGIANIE
jgi:hypothetical protein